MYEIIPGILEKEWSEIEKKIEAVLPFAKTIHVDILDGKFAPNTTFLDPKPFAKYAKDVKLELHMMVDDPIKYIKPFADAGFQRFIGHIEKMPDQVAFVAEAQLWGEVGLALDKKTHTSALKVPLDDLDSLLVMSIQAGFSGQMFEEELLEKIKHLSAQTMLPFEVDGGINDETILIAKAYGATRFVSTSFLFGFDNPTHQFNELQRLLDSETL